MKYDVGIYTFWDVPNYGTFAQAYALQRVVDSFLSNKECYQIAYLDKKHFDGYYSRFPTTRPTHKVFYLDLIKRLNPYSQYNKKKKLFLDSYDRIKHTERMTADVLKKTEFETVVLGSDIIWDFSFELFNHDPFLFGVGLNTNKTISYAASFGTITPHSDFPEYIRQGISKMNAISVRDDNSADIIEMLTGKRPEIVLDPTWLWDFYNDANIPKSDYGNFMIVYGQDFSSTAVSEIVAYAKKRNYKLVCLDCNDDNYSWCDVVIKQYKLSPFEWIALFRDAETIATTTFHGLTFSLIFNKRFAFCRTPFIMAKASSFLKELGIYDLFAKKNVTIEEMIEYDWDYKKINKVIDNKREKSIIYLKKALQIEE